MAVTFRADKGAPLSYGEMDTNLGSYFYSSSKSQDESTLFLHFTSSINVPISQSAHAIPLGSGLPVGGDKRIIFYSGSSAATNNDGFIAIKQGDGTVHVGINVDEVADIPLTYELEVSGSIRASAAVYQSSDERLKDNIETISNSLTKVLNSRGVSFDKDGRKNLGVIAQEIQNNIPEVVSEDNNSYLSVNYNGITGVLIEAIKEQNALIKDLSRRVEELENIK